VWLQGLVVAAAIVLSLILAPRAIGWAKQAFRGIRFWPPAALALASVLFCLVMARDETWPTLGLAAMLLVAVGLEVWQLRTAAPKPGLA
jgi:hypothetical protein